MISKIKRHIRYLTVKKFALFFAFSVLIAMPLVFAKPDYCYFAELFGVTDTPLPERFSDVLKTFFPHFNAWWFIAAILISIFNVAIIYAYLDRDFKVGHFSRESIISGINNSLFPSVIFVFITAVSFYFTRFLSSCVLYYMNDLMQGVGGKVVGLLIVGICYSAFFYFIYLLNTFVPNVIDKGLTFQGALSYSIVSGAKNLKTVLLPLAIMYIAKHLLAIVFCYTPPIVGFIYNWITDALIIIFYVVNSYLTYYRENGKKRADYIGRYYSFEQGDQQ